MYKAATRNPALLKRLIKHVSNPYKLVIPKRDPSSSRFVNAAHHVSGPKGSGVSPARSVRRVFSFDAQSVLVQWQRKWLAQPIVTAKYGINSAAAMRSARLYSGKPNEKRNIEKHGKASSNLSQKQGTKEIGCTLKKPSKKGLSEENASTRSNESCVGNKSCVANGAQKHEYPNAKFTVLEKRKRGSSKSTVNNCTAETTERKKTYTATISTGGLEAFDRLQLIKGKLIRNLGQKWLSVECIRDTFANFPYYLNRNTRDLLLDCVAARLKNHNLSMFGEGLPYSSHLIRLQGQPGTQLYQETLVRALAHELQTSLLVINSRTLSAKDLKDDDHIAGIPVHDNNLDDDEKDLDVDNEVNRMALSVANLERWNQMVGSQVKIVNLKNTKKKPHQLLAKKDWKEMSELVEVDNNEDWENNLKNLLVTGREDQLKKLGKRGDELKQFWHDLVIGDHVRYKGPKATKGKIREKATIGQEGFVTSISDSLPWKVCVKFQGEAEEVFCDAVELEKVNGSGSDETWLARFPELPIEALCKMVGYGSPAIVHFPDIQQWFSSVPSNGRALLLKKVEDLLTKVDGPVAFIASSFKEEISEPRNIEDIMGSFLSILENPEKEARVSRDSKADDCTDAIWKIFKNVINILPPEEPQHLHIWQKVMEKDKKKAKREKNLILLKEILEKNCMKCPDMMDLDTFDLQLTPESAEDIVGWARNMVYHSNLRRTSDRKLVIRKGCLQRSLARLNAFKVADEEKMSYITTLAENEYEKSLLSSVILSHEIEVKFDEIGALEDVKSTLNELIVLPLKRPELFMKGNLRKPCKGVLLFGPPGTGKTLVAKAVATEAGANFINISSSSLTSKYYGDDEKLVKALFAMARKLSPSVIFVDEVDSLLGERGLSSEHEATRRIKNEFMAAWDGLQSKESEQILVFATTNRPFDLDDAVIRRLPRRILVDLPNTENRAKILRKILANEDLDNTFSYETLALQTEGYSGSDLKNLCVMAAYVPIRELLEVEHQASTGSKSSLPHNLRPLCMNDFLQAKAKIGASLAYDAAAMIQLRQWNEQYGEGGSRCQKRMGFSP